MSRYTKKVLKWYEPAGTNAYAEQQALGLAET